MTPPLDKKSQILQAAERLFAIKGYDGTPIRDIAVEAGVNIAMISYYFGSKDKLLQALVEERMAHIQLRIETLINDDSLAPFDKINTLVDDYIERLSSNYRFHKIMTCEQLMEKNAEVIEAINRVKSKNSIFIERLLESGQSKGVFRGDVDPVMMMNTIIGTINHTLLNRPYYRITHKMEHMAEAEFEQHLRDKLSAHLKAILRSILRQENIKEQDQA